MTVRTVVRRVAAGFMLWPIVFAAVLLGVGPGWRGAPAALGVLLIGISTARDSSTEVARDNPPPARRRRLGSVWSARVGFALLAIVTVADAVLTPHLSRRYGAASILVPAVAVGALVTGRVVVASVIPVRARRIANSMMWLAFCALGAMLVSGIPSRHDEQLGAWLLAGVIGSIGFLCAPVSRVFNRGWLRVKPAAKALFGDWENDVGFAGDSRGSRERVPIDPPTSNAAVLGRARDGGAGID